MARFPGVMLAALVAMAAGFLADHYGAPVMLMALLLGMAFNFLRGSEQFRPGTEFMARRVLRIGVALLGARLTLGDVAALPSGVFLGVVLGLVSTIALGAVLAPVLGRTRWFGVLTGGSVGICGASAALAISSVLPSGRNGITERDVVFTVVAVTTLSTFAMVLYPLLSGAMGMSETEAGIFMGATIHDVAQVVGAGYSVSDSAGEVATLIKLLRVAFLIPVVLGLYLIARSGGTGRAEIPWFLLAFLALMLANTAGFMPMALLGLLVGASKWALICAVAALGVKTQLGEIARVGPRALAIVLIETVWIAAVALSVLSVLPQG